MARKSANSELVSFFSRVQEDEKTKADRSKGVTVQLPIEDHALLDAIIAKVGGTKVHLVREILLRNIREVAEMMDLVDSDGVLKKAVK